MGGERGGRSTPRLIADAFGLYRRYPLLFLALAAAVIVPYELIVLAATGDGDVSGSSATAWALSLLDLFLVGPLVSALHVRAVSDLRQGEEPRLGSIARRGLAALPVVSAAAIMSGLGAFAGAVLFLIPGVYLWIRWSVVAQAAAIERQGWVTALRHSWSLTEGSWFHAFVFVICVTVIAVGPLVLLNLAWNDRSVGSFLIETALSVLLVSFAALATALLYYDLRVRREALAAESRAAAGPPPPPAPSPADHGFDPRAFSDEDRPNGWYVDPEEPNRMRYWDGAAPGWRGRTRTPHKLRRRWADENG
ncbi:MAG TPA: hypothetical protein VEB65_04290 [Solirubrobacterales bacterium]|nr:hypothetical protein [Solirubrobacterales bacterium]